MTRDDIKALITGSTGEDQAKLVFDYLSIATQRASQGAMTFEHGWKTVDAPLSAMGYKRTLPMR